MNDFSQAPAAAAGAPVPETPRLPHNVEAEQNLLGAILVNNDVFDRVSGLLTAADFFEPVHARIWEAAEARIQMNAIASPVSLKPFLEGDPAFEALGGAGYLVNLAGGAVAAFAARDYARLVHDLAVRRSLITIGGDIAERARKVEHDTAPDDQIVEAEQALYSLAETGREGGGFKSFLRAVTGAVKVAAAAHQRDGDLSGYATLLTDLDAKLGGLHRSDLIILAGRPSMGKTSLATNIAFNIAKSYRRGDVGNGEEGTVSGGVVGFFSLEMSAEQLANRVLSEAAEISSERIRRGDLNEAEFLKFVEAAKTLEACPLHIDDQPALSIAQVAARARRLKRVHGLDLLIVDYLQLMRGTGRSDNRVNEISEITQGLKAIAKELDIPVLALSQLSRQVESREDKRPQLSDLRESGSIEQDADVVMFVFREEYYKEREKPGEHELEKYAAWQQQMEALHGRAEVIIGKQRHGPIGTVDLAFEGRFTRFGNLAKPWQEQVR